MIKNDRYEILTPNGFKKFDSITKSKKRVIKIKTKNFVTIVSENHPFDVMGEIYSSSNLQTGMLLDTKKGLEMITSIEPLNVTEEVFDIINVDETKNFIGDGIVHHNCFYGSTYTLIEIENLMAKKKELGIQTNDIGKAVLYPIRNFNVKIYKKPEIGRCYVCGVDTGDGVGANESVIVIYDITNPVEKIEQVASFSSNKISTTELAYLIAKLCNLYNSPPVMIESNNMGSTVIKFLYMIYEYENIAKISMKKGRGIFSHNSIKVEACLNFKLYLDNPELHVNIYEPLLYTQLEWFQRVDYGNGQHTYKAEKGRLDDHVLASIWAFYILNIKNLEYFFDFEIQEIGLEKLPAKLRQFATTSTNTQERDNFLDNVFNELENKMKLEEHFNMTSISSTESVIKTKQKAVIKSEEEEDDDLFFKNIGFMQ